MALRRSVLRHAHHVLVVDDCPEVREAFTCLLEVHGCQVVTVGSGREAFAAFERGLRPCMMLLDLSMPDMTGWELWDRMRADAELQATPVVIVSADVADPARARAVGIRDVLQKPRIAPDVVRAVERHCRVGGSRVLDDSAPGLTRPDSALRLD
jgi:CheY-like chemotaxis protein